MSYILNAVEHLPMKIFLANLIDLIKINLLVFVEIVENTAILKLRKN
jgi:hypothetical protein